MPELRVNAAAFLVDCVGDVAPSADLFFAPDTRSVGPLGATS